MLSSVFNLDARVIGKSIEMSENINEINDLRALHKT